MWGGGGVGLPADTEVSMLVRSEVGINLVDEEDGCGTGAVPS